MKLKHIWLALSVVLTMLLLVELYAPLQTHHRHPTTSLLSIQRTVIGNMIMLFFVMVSWRETLITYHVPAHSRWLYSSITGILIWLVGSFTQLYYTELTDHLNTLQCVFIFSTMFIITYGWCLYSLIKAYKTNKQVTEEQYNIVSNRAAITLK